MNANRIGKKLRLDIVLVFYFLLAALLAMTVLYPLIKMLFISFKTPQEFFTDPLGFPKTLNLSNFLTVWKEARMDRLFLNTVAVTAGTIALTLLVASLAAFAIAKYEFAGKHFFYKFFMIGLLVPVQVLMVSLMKVTRLLHLRGSPHLLLIFLFTVFSLSLAIFIYTGFFKQIPRDLIDAAVIDGASFPRILLAVALPVSGSTSAIVAILVGMNPWKDFLIPLLFTMSEDSRTLSLGIQQFQSSFFTNWTLVFAMMVMQSIPMIVLFAAFQKYFIKGALTGSIK